MPIELNKVKEYAEQSVLLLGQATNSVTYHRRYNILSALNCAPQQSKGMLREEADLLQQKDKKLFGKKFRKHLISSAKSMKQTIELCCDKGNKKQKPFRYGPPEIPMKSSGGPQKFVLKKNSSGTARQQQSFGGYQQGSGSKRQNKNKQKGNLVQDVISTCNSNERIIKSSVREVPKLPPARRIKHFAETWKIMTRDSEILELVERYKIPFNKDPVQQKIPETPHIKLDMKDAYFSVPLHQSSRQYVRFL